METQSDRLHPRRPIRDDEKRPISHQSFQLGSARLGIAKHTVPYGMRSEPRSFFSPVSSFRFRQGPTNFFTGPDLPGPLCCGDAPARDGSRSGRRDPQCDSGALAQPRYPWPLEIAQLHLSSRSELCRKARPQSSIFTNASGRAAAGRR
jgi:hypothetical protein